MEGILNLYKPVGPTSHDCIYRVRRALQMRRVGHAGTLDPLASGVLVVGVGHGTRVLEYLQGLPKTYRAGLTLGVVTDSQDTSGRVVSQADASALTEEDVTAALAQFLGEGTQLPPMFSALKVRGQKLYDLARRGEQVERERRPVTLYSLDLLSFQPGERAQAEFRVTCSAGTYIRTLCHDVGEALGVGGVMHALEREAVGEFRAADAVALESLSPETPLIPLAQALRHLPSITVSEEEAQRLVHGQFIPVPDDVPAGPICVLNSAGRLLALGAAHGHGDERLLTPQKVLMTADTADAADTGT